MTRHTRDSLKRSHSRSRAKLAPKKPKRLGYWQRLEETVRRVLAEVIATEARHGNYDGATSVDEDEWAERGKKRIGF